MLRRLLLLIPISAGLSQAYAGACADKATIAELNRSMDKAETAYGSLDLDGFMGSSDLLRTDLPCLGEPMTRVVAERIHRIEGLRGYLDGDRRAASQSFAAARALNPDYSFPDTLVPAGYPEFELYNALDLTLGSTSKVDPMIDGYVLLDGKVGNDRPTDWPTIVQVINEDGDVVVTKYVRPGEPMPSYYPEAQARAQDRAVTSNPDSFTKDDPFADDLGDGNDWSALTGDDGGEDDPGPASGTPPTRGSTAQQGTTGSTSPRSGSTGSTKNNGNLSASVPKPEPRYSSTGSTNIPHTKSSGRTDDPMQLGQDDDKKGHPVGLLTFSLLSAVASGVSYGVALHSATEYRDTTTTYDQLDALRLNANLWSGVSAGTALVAIGSGIAVGVSW